MGLEAAFGHAKPAGQAVQFEIAPPKEYIPAGHGTI